MGKRGKKKAGQRDGTASKTGRKNQSNSPMRRAKISRNAIWAVCGLLVVAAIVVAWTTLRDESPKTSASTLVEQPQAEVPAEKLDTAGSKPIAGAPQISFPEMAHDFGTITQGSKVSHKFVVRNIGDAPLRLIRAQGS